MNTENFGFSTKALFIAHHYLKNVECLLLNRCMGSFGSCLQSWNLLPGKETWYSFHSLFRPGQVTTFHIITVPHFVYWLFLILFFLFHVVFLLIGCFSLHIKYIYYVVWIAWKKRQNINVFI